MLRCNFKVEDTDFALTGKQSFSIQLPMPVWRSRFDPGQEWLAVELREAEATTTAFSVIKLPVLQAIMEPLSYEDGWWLSLKDVGEGCLVIQEFTDAENPQSVQTFFQYIRQEHTSALLEGYIHLGFWEGKSFGYFPDQEGEKTRYALVDCWSGSASELTSEEADKIISRLQKLEKALNFPNLYPEGSDAFLSVQRFMQHYFKQEIVRQVEYLEVGDKILISYFTQDGEGLMNELLVLDDEGKMLTSFRLANERPGTTVDTFWVYKNLLILLTDQKTITGYELY